MKKILLILSATLLTSCAEDGLDGKSVKQENVNIDLSAVKGVSSTPLTSNKQVFILVPQSLLINVAHSAGSPGWITLELGSKTFCYFAQGGSAAGANKNYTLNAVREGLDTSCQSGATTNTTYNLIHRVEINQNLKMNIHTPRIANGEVINLTLDGVTYE